MYQTYKPKSDQLRKYIQEFTVLDNDGMFPKEYLAFPHQIGAIVFMEKAGFQFEAGILKLDKNPTQDSLVITIGKYLAPLLLIEIVIINVLSYVELNVARSIERNKN